MTIKSLVHDAEALLKQVGIASATLDTQLLMAHALQVERKHVLFSPENTPNSEQIYNFNAYVARRARYEPIAYITGKKEFWSLDFSVTSDTLIPRPDSETLVEAALRKVKYRSNMREKAELAILDIGTGSGCLLVALLKELPKAKATGADNSERALRVAEENARRHGVDSRALFLKSHWCDSIDGTFDLIISNPPYIAAGDLGHLMPDVSRFEPHTALVAGADGLDSYRALAPQVALKLNKGGLALFEVGEGQADDVAALLRREGLAIEAHEKDLNGIARCVVAVKQ